jgi:hypothetical protein
MATGTSAQATGYAEYSADGVDLLLPLPDQLQFDTEYNWEAADTGMMGALLEKYRGKSFTNMLSGANLGGDIKDLLTRAAAQPGSEAANVLAEKFGKVVNPKTEILFRGVRQREFVMDFSIAYKAQEDMATFFEKLNQLYYACAPSVDGEIFFTAPKTGQLNVFDQDGNNIIMPRTCAVKRISTNLTPDNVFACYTNGRPLHVKLSLGFIELTPPTKDTDQHIFY